MTSSLTLAMPVRNGERFMEAAIESIRAQSFSDFELILLDNASTDRTREIGLRYARLDPRIRYHRNRQDIGAGGNFNLAVFLASGRLFKWCAHDDVVGQHFLKLCIAALTANPAAVTAYGRLQGIDYEGKPTGYVELPLGANDDLCAWRRFRQLMYRQGLDAAIFGVHRRSALLSTSLHRPYYGSDCALLAELALLGPFVHVPGAVLFNRDHPTRSVNLASNERSAWQAPAGAAKNPAEFTQRVLHLLEIAVVHRKRAPLVATAGAVGLWSAHPLRLGRMVLEGIGFISPSLRTWLRGAGLTLLQHTSRAFAARSRRGA